MLVNTRTTISPRFGGPGAFTRAVARRRVAAPVLMFRRSNWGLAGPLEDAQAKLTQAGYQGVTCRTERISLPMPDPATGLTYYDQNYCSAPGYVGGFQVEAVNNMAVGNLAAERASLSYNASNPGYFGTYGSGSQALTTTAAANPPQNQAVYPVYATLRNLSRPGAEMRVGDSWQLEISGKPNSPITVTASHNGAGSSSSFGSTDGAGRRILSGTFDTSVLGVWSQTWTVAGQSATVNFTVLPVSGTGSSSNNTTGTNTGNNNTQNQTGSFTCPAVLKTCPDGSTVGYDPSNRTGCVYLSCPSSGGGPGESWLDKKLNIGGFEVPMVAAAGVAALGLMFAMGGRR